MAFVEVIIGLDISKFWSSVPIMDVKWEEVIEYSKVAVGDNVSLSFYIFKNLHIQQVLSQLLGQNASCA